MLTINSIKDWLRPLILGTMSVTDAKTASPVAITPVELLTSAPVAIAPVELLTSVPADIAPAVVKPQLKRKRKYKKGEIKPWMRPPLDDDSADEGNDRDEWEEKEFQSLCLCVKPRSMDRCTCGCLVTLSREQWHKVQKLSHYVSGDA